MTENRSRASILGRIRQALQSPAPTPHWHADPSQKGAPLFPLPADSIAALKDRFQQELKAVQGQWHELAAGESVDQWLAEWIATSGHRSILAVGDPTIRSSLVSLRGEFASVAWCDPDAASRAGWEDFDVGITPCESLIAESGTVVVAAASSGRAPSVLPPAHLVIATPNQFVPDIETAIARLRSRYPAGLPSNISFITGPSRTGDIEKILVLGAHGPKRLTVLLLPDGGPAPE